MVIRPKTHVGAKTPAPPPAETLPAKTPPATPAKTPLHTPTVVPTTALVEVGPTLFEGTPAVAAKSQQLAQRVQKEPSRALNQPARIMDPRLLFAQLLEKPLVRADSADTDKAAWVPLQAKLPSSRQLAVGEVTFSHADGKLTVRGGLPGIEPEVVDKQLGFGDAARWALAFDAALLRQYPRFPADEPKELWIGFLDARRATDVALKIDGGRSAFDAARVLREFTPGAKQISGAQTTTQQLEAFGALARSVMDGPGTPTQNIVRLEEQGLQAKDSSLLMQLLQQSDQKVGKASLLDEILSRPAAGRTNREPARRLPDDDKAVVANLDGKDITAGEIRAMALRSQPAVQFILPGFKDANGHEHDLQIHVERKEQGFEWSFYGVDKKVGGMGILSGQLSPRGLEQFRNAIEQQGRWDMIPYKTSGETFAVSLADSALAALHKDRQELEAQVKARGGTPLDEVFAELGKTGTGR